MSSKKYVVLNTLLCSAIILLAIGNYATWNHPAEFLPVKRIVQSPPPFLSPSRGEDREGVASTIDQTYNDSYNFISEKNIFSPDRRDFPALPAAVAEALKPVVRPQIVLYGVAIAGDYQSATVSNPGRPLRKGEREMQTIRIGQKIGDYKLAKILPDRIAMENNGDAFEVLLYTSKKKIEAGNATQLAMNADPESASAKAPNAASFEDKESAEKLKEMVLARTPASNITPAFLPFNKYTYQLASPSAIIKRGRILNTPPGS